MDNPRDTVELDRETAEIIVLYLGELIRTTDSGEYAIQVDTIRQKIKEKLK